MFGPAKGLQTKFFEEKTIATLETIVNEYIAKLELENVEVLDIKYHSDKEEYTKHFTAMIVFRTTI